LLAAAFTTTADAAKKKAAAPKPDPAVAAQANSAKFIGDALTLGGPPKAAAPAKPAKKAKKAKKKAAKKKA